jgi:DNA-binding MarR family transcriptional regulator
MPELQKADDFELIFSAILVVANRMDTLLERLLRDNEVTAKQWFLMNALNRWFHSPPTMKELAREMGSSHQNVKQVALKLQDKGLLELVRDNMDGRIIRLRLTEKSHEFWASTAPAIAAFMREFYADIGENDLGRMAASIAMMMENLNRIERNGARNAAGDV